MSEHQSFQRPPQPEPFSADPAVVMAQIDVDAQALDRLTKAISAATDEVSAAEEAWERAWDEAAEELKDEMQAADRKGDPAEHTILSRARRNDREAWHRFRRAKRDLDALERILQAKRASLSGRQSNLAGLRDEARAQDHGTQRGGHVHGSGRRMSEAERDRAFGAAPPFGDERRAA